MFAVYVFANGLLVFLKTNNKEENSMLERSFVYIRKRLSFIGIVQKQKGPLQEWNEQSENPLHLFNRIAQWMEIFFSLGDNECCVF